MRLRVLPVLLAMGAACGGEPPESGPVPADTAQPDPAATAERVRIVLVAGPLRSRPAAAAPAVTEAAAGTTLRLVSDTTAASGRWLRLATWDDRKGWMPEDAVLDAGLWTHYVETLGGATPAALRPAYPMSGGRWGAEKPFPSPDLDPPAEVWLAADSLVHSRVVGRDTLRYECTGARHSMAVLERGIPGAGRPDGGAIAIPASRPPAGRTLPVGALDPEAGLLEAIADATDAALAAAPSRRVPEDALPPPEPGAEARLAWRAVGEDGAWAVATWHPSRGREAGTMPGRWAGAFLAIRGAGGWSVRTVLPLQWTTVAPAAPPWRLLAAVATVPGRPTLLAVESLQPEGSRIDLLLADERGFRRLYAGFYRGC
ncbi:MAG: hypothetical protein KY397_01320 [Gemmatimonadetes bacterium]|nr:hypothetical protein [Gemmatimonadota bacterium]